MRTNRTTTRKLVALVAGTAVIVAACSSSKKSSLVSAQPAATAAAGQTGAAPTTTGAVVGTAVTATENEYKIILSQTSFKRGTYTFVIKNVGTMKHDLIVDGPGVARQRSLIVLPGQTGELSVSLGAGSYELWCSVTDHKAKGMDLHIDVGGALGPAPTPPPTTLKAPSGGGVSY